MRSKYGAKRCEWNGRSYASKAEMEYHRDVLDLLLKAGEIEAVECQPRIKFTPRDIYIPDYLVKPIETDPATWYWVDVKGMQTDKFKKDVQRWKDLGPGELRIVKKRGKTKWSTESVYPDSSRKKNWLRWCESFMARHKHDHSGRSA